MFAARPQAASIFRLYGRDRVEEMPVNEEGGPVTVSVARRVRPGREADYENWVHGICGAAREFPGHLGVEVLRPGPRTNNEYVIIYRFDTFEHGRAWETSEARAANMSKLDGLVAAENRKKVSGLEFWFDLPELPATAHPSQHKMALTLIGVVFSLLILLNLLLAPVLGELNWVVRTLIIVIFQVLLMTYVVMPKLTRLLKDWLYSSDPTRS